jgi:hypothetical protein
VVRYLFTTIVCGGTGFDLRYASYKRTGTHLDFPETYSVVKADTVYVRLQSLDG